MHVAGAILLHRQQFLLPFQHFVICFIQSGNMMSLFLMIFFLDDTQLISHVLDVSLELLVTGLKVLLALKEKDWQACQAVRHVDDVQDGTDADDSREDEAQGRLILLQIVHQLVLPVVELLVVHRFQDSVGPLLLLVHEVRHVELRTLEIAGLSSFFLLLCEVFCRLYVIIGIL